MVQPINNSMFNFYGENSFAIELWGGWWWWWWVYLDYNVSSGPFLSFEIEIGDGPGPELDN